VACGHRRLPVEDPGHLLYLLLHLLLDSPGGGAVVVRLLRHGVDVPDGTIDDLGHRPGQVFQLVSDGGEDLFQQLRR